MGTDTVFIEGSNPERRRFLVAATTVVGVLGAVPLAVPFIASMNPSSRAKSSGAPIKFDISKLQFGQQVTLAWRGKPIWVLHRTAKMLERLNEDSLLEKLSDPASDVISQQPSYAKNASRAINSEYFVAIGLCTHLGCIPNYRPDVGAPDLSTTWPGGYFCPCHGSKFDLAGRVYKGVPAPTNLVIPPYQYLTDNVIEIGTDASV